MKMKHRLAEPFYAIPKKKHKCYYHEGEILVLPLELEWRGEVKKLYKYDAAIAVYHQFNFDIRCVKYYKGEQLKHDWTR